MNQNDASSLQESVQVVCSPRTAEQPALITAATRPVVRVMGVGNAGTNLVDALVKQGFPARDCAVLNSDWASLSSSLAGQKISMEAKQSRGLGCGGDVE